MNFLTGIVVGIMLATVGAHGVANFVDQGVAIVKREAVQLSK